MDFEVFNRPLKLGDVVSASGTYRSDLYIYVVIGFTNQNVKLNCLNKYSAGIKPQVVLIENARKYFTPEMESDYIKICNKYNISTI